MSYLVEMYYKGGLVFRFLVRHAGNINDVEIFRGIEAREVYDNTRRLYQPFPNFWSLWNDKGIDVDRLRLFLMPVRKLPPKR